MDRTDATTPAEPAGEAPAEPPPTAAPVDLVQQFTAMAARMWGLATPGGTPPAAALPAFAALPQVGALSAQQVSAMTSTVRAQRQSIAALQSQLQAFDENLASLEQLLEPLRSWTSSWAALERGVLPAGPPSRPTPET
jgi:hypothetical protein